MPKPFKPTRPFPLPADADILEHAGRPHVRVKDRGRTIFYPLTKDGTKYLRPAKRWYFDLRDDTGTVRRVKGFADLRATEQLAAEMERKASRVRSGYADPVEEHVRRPLADHLTDYAAHLEAKGNTADHTQQTTKRVTALLAGCGFVFPRDADTGKVAEWLNSLRRDRIPTDLPDGDLFAPINVAKLLGISGTAVRSAVKRLNLPATGKGKARTFPRATVEALVLNKAKGCSPETVNHYVRSVRGFFRWLVKAKRLGSNPLESLSLVNAAVDVRHARRELTAEELRRLFNAAGSSTNTYRGLTGEDRYFLYLVAAGTGFRAYALANLTPSDFDLDAETVTLAARFNKIPPDEGTTASVCRVRCPSPVLSTASRPTRQSGAERGRGTNGARKCSVTTWRPPASPTSTEGPDGPEYADFHSLRHSYLTLGGQVGNRLADAYGTRRTLETGTHRPLFAPPALRPDRGRGQAAESRADRRTGLRCGGNPPSLDRDRREAGRSAGRSAGCSDRGHRAASICTECTLSASSAERRVDSAQSLEMTRGRRCSSTGPHRLALARATGLEPATTGSTGHTVLWVLRSITTCTEREYGVSFEHHDRLPIPSNYQRFLHFQFLSLTLSLTLRSLASEWIILSR